MENESHQVPGIGPEDSSHPTRNVPRPDIVLGHICHMVGQQWLKSKWLTVQWLSVDEFVKSAALYNALLTDKTVQGSGRPQITGHLRRLDKKINSSIEYIKGYLVDKYSKTGAPAYYAAFGIIRQGNAFIIPKHRHLRQESLAQMLKGIAQEGFTKNTYGQNFWADIKQKFDSYFVQATQMDSGVSEKTGNKNVLKKVLTKGLSAIVLGVKCNYPDTWKTELRNWGFQKEKY